MLVDPGPLGSRLPARVLDPVVARADWWSANAGEAEGAPASVRQLLVRLGADGCTVDGIPVPGFAVEAVDTNGAGDVHAGVFLAGLGGGLDPCAAAFRANAAAAIAVSRRGPTGAPTGKEIDAFLGARSADSSPAKPPTR